MTEAKLGYLTGWLVTTTLTGVQWVSPMSIACSLSPLAMCASLLLLPMAQSSPAKAQTTDLRPTSVGVSAGSLVGLGGTVGYDFSETFGVRAFAGTLDVGIDVEDSGSINMSLGGVGGVAAWYPTRGNWSIDFGLFSSENGITASLDTPDRNIRTSTNLEYDSSVTPFLGFTGRWFGNRNSSWQIMTNFGYLFRSTPNVTISASQSGCDYAVSSNGSVTTAGAGCIMAMENDAIEDDLENLHQEVEDAFSKVSTFLNLVGSLNLIYRF